MDKIIIKKLKLQTIIGVYESEQIIPQEILADIELQCDCRKAGKSDCLDDTIDYFQLSEKLCSHAQNHHYQLLEALAEALSALCLEDLRILSVTLTLYKKKALSNAEYAIIQITRNQN